MTLGKSQYSTYNFKLNDNPIEAQDTLRILSVTLDNNLTFIPHVKETVKLGLFLRLKNFVPKYVLLNLKKDTYSAAL